MQPEPQVTVRTADAADLAQAVEGAMAVTSEVLRDFLDARVRATRGRSDVAARLSWIQ